MKKRMDSTFWIAVILLTVGIGSGLAYFFGGKNLANLIMSMGSFILSHLTIIHGEIRKL